MRKIKCWIVLGLAWGSVFAFSQAQARNWRDFLSAGTTSAVGRGAQKSETSQEANESEQGLLELVDVPTAKILDYGAYGLGFRFYEQGGLLTQLSFGVFRRLNIGVSWDNEKVIGSQDPETNVPALQIKVRAFDGSPRLPSFTLGYDGQGRFFDRAKDEYAERERGIFIVFGREIFASGLELHAGSNIARFKEGKIYGFFGLSYDIENRLVLFTEYDNIRNGPESRWNIGAKLFPVPWLSIDFAFRKVGSNQDKERIARINYVGRF